MNVTYLDLVPCPFCYKHRLSTVIPLYLSAALVT